MARKLVVEVAADISQFVRGMTGAAKSTNLLDSHVNELSVDVRKLAETQVRATVKATERLQGQVVAYREIAAAAEKGSREQITAAKLAANAERKLAASLGATAHEEARAGAGARRLDRDLSRAARGAASGSGLFHSFGRSLVFASGGFVAFQGVTEFLRASIDAAREAGVAQRSLAAQMKTSGESFAANREEVEKVANSYARFGFQNDEVIASLTVLERGTGKLDDALRLQMLTADIARAKNIDLASAANVVAKVFGGQETALRRAVPGLEKNAHGWDLIREAQRKVAGQAAANTTAAERFQAALHDTEEIIGTALLPVLNQYLDSLGKWLSKTKNQEKLQRDANKAAKAGVTIFGALATAVGAAADAYGKYEDALKKLPGGKSGFLKTLFGGTIFAQFKDFENRTKHLLEIFGLRQKPSGLGGPVGEREKPVGAPPGLTGPTVRPKPPKPSKTFELPFRLQLEQARADASGVQAQIVQAARDIAAFIKKILPRLKGQKLLDAYGLLANANATIRTAAQEAADKAREAADKAKAAAKAAAERAKAEAEAAKQFGVPLGLQVAEARAQALGQALKPILIKIRQAALKAIHSGRLGAQGYLDAWNTLAQVNQQLADEAQKLKATFEVPLQLQVAQARAEALGKSVIPILKKIRAAAQKALKSGRLGLQGQLDAWNTIAQVNQQLKDLTKKTTKTAADAVNAVTKVTRQPTILLPPAFFLAGARPSPAVGGYSIQNLNLYGVQDVRALENELTSRSGTRPQPRRGT